MRREEGELRARSRNAAYTGHGGLFELRLKAAEGIARVFYCTVVDRRIVVLHQFVKKTQQTPRRELAVARRRMKDVRHD